MHEAALAQYIVDAFPNVEDLVVRGDHYFYHHADPAAPRDHRFPFATLVTSDAHDQVSQLHREGVYRLNIGLSKTTFQSLFGGPAEQTNATVATPPDYTALDRIMPHPVYGKMYWVCVLNPSDETLRTLHMLLAEAHANAKQRRD
ncbi:MAG TPA: DUF6194 family protein [Pirellulales bacterium]